MIIKQFLGKEAFNKAKKIFFPHDKKGAEEWAKKWCIFYITKCNLVIYQKGEIFEAKLTIGPENKPSMLTRNFNDLSNLLKSLN